MQSSKHMPEEQYLSETTLGEHLPLLNREMPCLYLGIGLEKCSQKAILLVWLS